MSGSELGTGAVEEAMLLLEDAAPPVLEGLLGALDGSAPDLVAVTLDAVGRLRLIDMADRVTGYLDSDEPEVRAAALRALGLMGHLPASACAAGHCRCVRRE